MAQVQITVLMSLRWWFKYYLLWVALRARLTGKAPIPNQRMMRWGIKSELVRTL